VRVSPFVRNFAILVVIALAIWALSLESALVTASMLVRVAFILAIAFVAYMLWRDFGRREIALWPRRAQWVFYGAVALLVADIGWFMFASLSGPDALVFFLALAGSIYAGVATWRRQHTYG
jgi:hypothetical protein